MCKIRDKKHRLSSKRRCIFLRINAPKWGGEEGVLQEIYFGIASYKRADNQRTIAYLEEIGIEKEKIILSVQSKADKEAYEAQGIHKRVGKFVYREGKNVSDNRNTLLDSVPAGTRIVLLDDDINAICQLTGKGLEKIKDKRSLYAMLNKGYSLAAKHRTVGFGLYPVKNAYFMSEGYKERNIVIGTLFAIVNTDLRFDTGMATKEDFEYCCKAIKRYGAFVRLNNYVCDAQHYTKGGCEEFWSDSKETQRTARRLVGKYPDILAINPKKPGEVRMKKRRKGER